MLQLFCRGVTLLFFSRKGSKHFPGLLAEYHNFSTTKNGIELRLKKNARRRLDRVNKECTASIGSSEPHSSYAPAETDKNFPFAITADAVDARC
jgi:hypothetical protein